LRSMQCVGFLALYVCALNSKEMAVTLPVIVLSYELLKYYHRPERQKLIHWILYDATPALLAGAITAIYCYKKIYGLGFAGPFSEGFLECWAPVRLPPWFSTMPKLYAPFYSCLRFIDKNAPFLNELFYLAQNYFFTGGPFLAIWALIFAYAILRRDRMVQLM